LSATPLTNITALTGTNVSLSVPINFSNNVYWSVTTYDTSSNSSVSTTNSFLWNTYSTNTNSADVMPPSVVLLLSPTNVKETNTSLNFTWSAATDNVAVLSYTLTLLTNLSTAPYTLATGLTGTNKLLRFVSNFNNPIYWFVTAYDTSSNLSVSKTNLFQWNTIPPVQILQVKALSATVLPTDNAVDLTYQVSQNFDGTAAVTYSLITTSAPAASSISKTLSAETQKNKLTIAPHQISQSASSENTNGLGSARWLVPADFDTSKSYSVVITATIDGVTADSAPIVLDLSKLFMSTSDLSKALLINSPYRGNEKGIIVANLPSDTKVEVFTVTGKKILTLAPANRFGQTVWVPASTGKKILPGVYLIQLNTASEKKVLKAMVLPE
jgi:hypothetical protein